MRLRPVLIAAIIAPLLAGLPASADTTLTRIPGHLRVLVSADEMPEVFAFDTAEKPGLEREMIENFARINRLQIQIIPVKNFEQIIPMLLRGDGDVITGIVDTDGRRKQIVFTTETYPVRHLVVTRKPLPAVSDPRALRALKVAVIPGTTWAEMAVSAGVPAANLVSCVDVNDVFAALRGQKAAAAIMTIFDFTLAQRREGLESGTFLGAAATAAWGVRKDDVGLLQALNTYLDSLRLSPARSALLTKYFNEDALSLLRRARKE
jgi:ABC-type amino acid transport substrate-binding protein